MSLSKRDQDHIVYEDEFIIVKDHLPNRPHDHRVAIRSGDDPETEPPTIVDGAKLQAALAGYIMGERP